MNQWSVLVTRTLAGMKKLSDFTNTNWKRALTEDNLWLLLLTYHSSNLDNLLFLAIIFSSFHALLCLRESTQPDTPVKHSFHKVTLCHSIKLMLSSFSFMLPTHKTDRFFKSSTILIKSQSGSLCPLQPFKKYLAVCDTHFPLHAQLWLHSTGEVPTYSWVVHLLKSCLSTNVTGHSLLSSRATALALAGIPDDHILACSWWSSQAYHVYLHKHPIMLQSLIHGCSTFDVCS